MIEELLKQLTLEEKIDMIHGEGLFQTKAVPRLGIPALKMSDGPMGVRQEFENDSWTPIGNSDDYVTYLPSNSAVASTWNRELAYETGKVLGEEARGRGKDMILAPGINIKRTPLCGRNFEYMSEDPYLIGELAVSMIQGIQTADVSACVKHFAVNNQETERLSVDVQAEERAMREIYLPAFEKAIKEGNSLSIMGAYNKYKGEHCCESKYLLNEILRKEWNYNGVIVSDWGGVHNTKEAVTSALDIEMSVESNFDEYYMANPLKKAIEAGQIREELIDEKIRNILRLMERLHMFEPEKRKKGSYNTPEHRKAALDTARESIVLLKNKEKKLPLSEKDTKKVLIIGDNANRLHSCGGGSAEIKALYEISPLMGIKKLLGGNAEVTYMQGYYADDLEKLEQEQNWQADSLEKNGGVNAKERQISDRIAAKQKKLCDEAIEMAKKQDFDTIIFIGGQNHQQDLEGQDRFSMKLPYGQDNFIEKLLKVRPDTILIIVSGSAVEMPWLEQAKTLVWSYYAGMEGGTALAEILFGKENPSGRLPETFPICYQDCSAHCIGEFPGEKTVTYKEGILVGYRYYNTKEIPVNFPFGYGVSYTEFAYTDLKVNVDKEKDKGKIKISLNITNVGERDGQETLQIYIGKKESSVERAKKELKAFTKVNLKAKECKKVTFELPYSSLAYYKEQQKTFVVESGIYTVYAGKSVEDICQTQEFEV